MLSRLFKLPWLGIVIVVVLVGGMLGGFAIAQTEGEQFTGCLSSNGNLNKVAIGELPATACKSNQTQITWNAEGQPGVGFRTDCAVGQIAQWDGLEWACADVPTVVDADTLDGLHANELIRVAYHQEDSSSNANGDRVARFITAPGPGLLVLSGSIDGNAPVGTADYYWCRLTVDDNPVQGTFRASLVLDDGVSAVNAEENCSTNGVQEVGPGVHRVALNVGDVNNVELQGVSIWAIYVPFDGSGDPITIP